MKNILNKVCPVGTLEENKKKSRTNKSKISGETESTEKGLTKLPKKIITVIKELTSIGSLTKSLLQLGV